MRILPSVPVLTQVFLQRLVSQRLPAARPVLLRAQRPGRVHPAEDARALDDGRRVQPVVPVHGAGERGLGPFKEIPVVPGRPCRAGEHDGALDKVGVQDGHVVGLLPAHGEADVRRQLLHAEGLAEGVLQMDVVFVGGLRE